MVLVLIVAPKVTISIVALEVVIATVVLLLVIVLPLVLVIAALEVRLLIVATLAVKVTISLIGTAFILSRRRLGATAGVATTTLLVPLVTTSVTVFPTTWGSPS